MVERSDLIIREGEKKLRSSISIITKKWRISKTYRYVIND